MMLTEDEYALIKIIRNKSKSITGINIKLKNNKIDRIELDSYKQVEIEGRLMDYIQEGGYQKIEITTHNGEITSFKNKQKIKI